MEVRWGRGGFDWNMMGAFNFEKHFGILRCQRSRESAI